MRSFGRRYIKGRNKAFPSNISKSGLQCMAFPRLGEKYGGCVGFGISCKINGLFNFSPFLEALFFQREAKIEGVRGFCLVTIGK